MENNVKLHELISAPDFYFAIRYAIEKDLFEISERGETMEEIAERIGLNPHKTRALILACMHLGVIGQKEGEFVLTAAGEQYLRKTSPHYMGDIITMMPTEYEMFKAGFEGRYPNIFTPEIAQLMVAMMHRKSAGLAAHWPSQVKLPENATFLDIGAGSAVHAIEACGHFETLRAIALDLPPVCHVMEGFIEQYGVSGRVRPFPCDMFKESWPEADIVFMSDILHDWSDDKAMVLLQKACDTLTPEGQIILLEVLLDEHHANSFVSVAFNLAVMKMLPEGGQRTGSRIEEMLEEAGFRGVIVKTPTHSGATLIQAYKA